MPLYDYKALSATGKKVTGIVEAENVKAGRVKLKKQGLMVTDMTEKTAARPSQSGGVPFIGNRVSASDLAMLTRQLASLVKANIPLVEALSALVEQMEKPALKVVIATVRQDVNEGLSLAKALAKHPKVFDNIYINMIEAGESSGTLGLILIRLADLREAQMRLRGKVISGMTYPALMMTVAVVLLLGLFTFVIPKLAKIFEGMNKEMPVMTQFLIDFSGILIEWWWLFLGAFAFTTYTFFNFIRSKNGKPKWDRFVLRTPLFGPLVRMIAITRFASTMATLLSSGVPILTAMSIARNLVGSEPIAAAIATARENITEGQSIAEPLKRSGEFPPVIIHMIAIGEKTGELPSMLQNVANNYEDQINSRIEGMTALLEPGMIIFMGLTVGFIVYAIFVPLMNVSDLS